MKKISFLIFFLSLKILAFGQSINTQYEEYIAKYLAIAKKEMKLHGIPASITLAQGLLESGAGQSKLAKKANNHFGIKCHNDWKGRKFRHDDDKRKECFRKYGNAKHSFKDHSLFLTSKSRYAFLFDLKTIDYKGWAKGLKQAGYATDPNYPAKLIKIIEDYKLYKYDKNIKNKKKRT
jgi:flagellum-specific peptidoglycan hydrolase FlgJ